MIVVCFLCGNGSRLNYACALMMLDDGASKKKKKEKKISHWLSINTTSLFLSDGLLM